MVGVRVAMIAMRGVACTPLAQHRMTLSLLLGPRSQAARRRLITPQKIRYTTSKHAVQPDPSAAQPEPMSFNKYVENLLKRNIVVS